MKPPKQAYTIICVRTSKNLQTPLQGALCREKGMRPVRVPACPGPSSTLSPGSCVVLVCWYVSTRVCVVGGGGFSTPSPLIAACPQFPQYYGLSVIPCGLLLLIPQVRPTSSAFLSELPLRPPVPVCDLTSSFRFVRAPPPHRHSLSVPNG